MVISYQDISKNSTLFPDICQNDAFPINLSSFREYMELAFLKKMR